MMTREEAIDILFGVIQANSEEENEALDMAIEALEQTQWIPCSERLPKIEENPVLVTTDGSNGDVIDIALYMSDGWHKASEVLAWKPLPEPYRKENQ